jgi:hypothetical protein
MMASNGFPTTNNGLPYADLNVAPPVNMHMPVVPPLTYGNPVSEGVGNRYMSNVNFENYIPNNTLPFQQGQQDGRSPPTRKLKRETPSQHGVNSQPMDSIISFSDQQTPAIHSNGPPPHMTHEINLLKVHEPKSKGRGRGKGVTDKDGIRSPKSGKGRARSQGVVIPISHLARQEALAEQARKRKRVDGDEPQDDSQEHILQGLLTKESGDPESLPKKRKPETKGVKREHHACDRCFRNKTKVR